MNFFMSSTPKGFTLIDRSFLEDQLPYAEPTTLNKSGTLLATIWLYRTRCWLLRRLTALPMHQRLPGVSPTGVLPKHDTRVAAGHISLFTGFGLDYRTDDASSARSLLVEATAILTTFFENLLLNNSCLFRRR